MKALRTKLILVTAGLVLTMTSIASASPFSCKRALVFKDFFKKFSKAQTGRISDPILVHHAAMWMHKTGAERCEAHARGEDVKLGCLHEELDRDAILASIPDGLLEASNKVRAEYMRKIRKSGRQRKAGTVMTNACIRAGLSKGKIIEVD